MPIEKISARAFDFTQVRTNSETLNFGSIAIQASRNFGYLGNFQRKMGCLRDSNVIKSCVEQAK
jgi:hypothetical protein